MSGTVALDPRLLGAANYVRQGAYFADIGTDHAFLPVFLLERGRIAHAVCSDIAKGPLQRARATVAAAGLIRQVTLLHTPGLEGMESLGLTDIAICGMGGEMIGEILGNAPFVKNPNIRLILQPMTKAAYLRGWLSQEGFRIEEETVVTAQGKHYAVLCASYTGEPYVLTPLEREVGRWGIDHLRGTPSFVGLVKERIVQAQKQLHGREIGLLDTKESRALLTELENLL